ncbi:MAG: hypothetical protein ACYTGO_09295 [Planctomycetota bacterium]|jgi:hypothetical protein
MNRPLFLASCVLLLLAPGWAQTGVRVDHTCTQLAAIPANWITKAKQVLHIAYGHTSHGSQLTSGMSGLVTFSKGGPQFAFNNGGSNGALDLHDRAMGGDVGYYPQWVNNTRAYLDNPANKDVNVIIWSWCGQVSTYTQQRMVDAYLAPMTKLEKDYPQVTFVYMTGHLDINKYQNTYDRNQQIRAYCKANNKVLYDFADIESFDPDGKFYQFANDNCDYFNKNKVKLGNWAINWQNSHVLGVDWYSCSSAHSQPLNANLKAYAAWWLWARLAGWQGTTALKADAASISAQTGGRVQFTLSAGAAFANRGYILVGSASGTSPGVVLPGGKTILPIVLDQLTWITLDPLNKSVFNNFWANLDSTGAATASLILGPVTTDLIGYSMHYAYGVYNPYDFTSNAVAVRIVR